MSRDLRVLTWNVQDLLGDPLAVHRVLRAAAADVVLLQEAPRRIWAPLLIGPLARGGGLQLAAGGWRSAGTAVLVSPGTTVVSAEAFRLPTPGRFAHPRGAAVVRVRQDDGPEVTAACLHLDLGHERRAEHLELLRGRLAGTPRLVVAGDFNEAPGGPTWGTLLSFTRDPAPSAPETFPLRRLKHRIDAVLVSDDLEVTEYDRWRADPHDLTISSDHRPVLAVLRT
jgi:endonuclease/exonuclease/phosphatase family metal-dependent hydrolase